MPVTAVLAVGLFARRTLHPVASRRPDDVRQHDVDSEEAAAAGFEEEHEPVMVLVAFVPRLRDVGGADEGECETRLLPPRRRHGAGPGHCDDCAVSHSSYTGCAPLGTARRLEHGNARRDVDEPLG